jgi:type IV pilus assembly protein PilE
MKTISRRDYNRQASGFTLIELMIVLVIVSILTAIAYPSYQRYIVKSNRQAARSMIYAIADRQEQFFLDNKAYAADLSTLGYADDTIYVGRDGQLSGEDADDLIYSLQIVDAADTSYTVMAEPEGVQADRDTDCGNLSLTSSGQRDQSGDGENCW